MVKLSFREHHLFSLLTTYDQQTLPLDLFINHYFREHKALGSKDRGFIAETVYALVRWRGLLDYLCARPLSWETRFQKFQQVDLKSIQNRKEIPPHIRVSCPKALFHLIESSYGIEKAIEICLVSNTPAPTTVRVNLFKTTRDALLESWAQSYEVSPTSYSPDGIIFHKKMNFFELPEFKSGLFEVQDEGSQLLAQLIRAQPGDHVLDYCAGSGGKTLAFAPKMQHKGQIYLHDIRETALQEAKKRLKRAGIQNSQILPPHSPILQKLKKKMNWVLVDAPCSGTGTMRRNPGMKWNFNEQMLNTLLGQQRAIFEKALSFMHPEGKIIYGTCSLLKEENEMQVEHFTSTYQLIIEDQPFKTLPTLNGMDGFFGVVLKRS